MSGDAWSQYDTLRNQQLSKENQQLCKKLEDQNAILKRYKKDLQEFRKKSAGSQKNTEDVALLQARNAVLQEQHESDAKVINELLERVDQLQKELEQRLLESLQMSLMLRGKTPQILIKEQKLV